MTKPKKPNPPGPEADHLKIDGDWRDAMNKALKKERPKDGWPEQEEDEKKDK